MVSQEGDAYQTGWNRNPKARPGVEVIAFDGLPKPDVFVHLNELVEVDPFRVKSKSRTYSMYEMPQAIIDVQRHHIGKLVLAVKSEQKRAVSDEP